MKQFLLCAFFLCLSIGPADAQELARISGSLAWDKMELDVQVTLDLNAAGIRLPAGRSQAEALLEDEYPALIHPFIHKIQVDSSSTVGDMINRRELPLRLMNTFAANARRIPPSLSADMSALSARYMINVNTIGAEFIRHSGPGSIITPMIPVPVRDYTGIIIIADESLPVHGKAGTALPRPCLFPKIWDNEMNLIFERNMLDPRIGKSQSMVLYTSREKVMQNFSSALLARIGENPLRILARGVFGVVPTDPVIDNEDALLILSSESNRRLLREGRIVIVVDRTGLEETIP